MSSDTRPLYQNLDTTFVNLWSLLRSLTERDFIGRVHVELKDYSADIFIDGSATPTVREIDRASGTNTMEAGALHRVVLRARETPGTINVFAGADEASPVLKSNSREGPPPQSDNIPAAVSTENVAGVEQPRSFEPAVGTEPTSRASDKANLATPLDENIYPTGSYQDWPAILATAGELIAAVERGINAAGGNFDSLFKATRLELADDYVFLDPIANTFQYSSGVVSLSREHSVGVFVSGLSEVLRRAVDRVAVGDGARRARERVALEMLPVARQRTEVLDRSGFRAHLDRIAGTRVM